MRKPSLSPSELRSLRLLAEGWTGKEAAHTIRISPETFKNHTERARLKLGAMTTLQAAVIAARQGLI